MASSSTTDWLSGRAKWLQIATKRLLESGELNEEDISKLALLCKQEANDEFPDIDYSIPSNAFDTNDSVEIRLCSISEIAGVNKLAPKKPLNFGESNIAIVYGDNGSGKSGYVRLLKHICGARDCIRGQLHKNVFSTEDIAQKAKISFLKKNSLTEHEWSGQGVCEDLFSVDIFDTSFGRVFMGGEDEVSYEPPILSFFSKLIYVCDKVAMRLDTEAEALKSKMPNIPKDLFKSDGVDWLESVNKKTSVKEIESHCSFTQGNESELQDIQKRIAERSPADKAKQLMNKKKHADSIINDVQKYLTHFSDVSCNKLIEAKKQYSLKKIAAEAAANDVFSEAKLEGIGSDVWIELWEVARKYSEDLAYKRQKFPVVENDSVCVLCHQPLTEEAKQRFLSFESYIKGETQKQVFQAEKEVKQAFDILPDILSVETLKTKIDAAGIDNQVIITALADTVITLQDRKTKLHSIDPNAALKSIIPPPLLEEILKISQGYEASATKYLEDAEKDNREELQKNLNNLRAKKWLSPMC